MNFVSVEERARKAAQEGEQAAALNFLNKDSHALKSPTNTTRPQTAPSMNPSRGETAFNPNKLMTPEQDQQVWSLMQSRLFSQSHVNNQAYSMYNQSSNPFVLNSSTIPKQLGTGTDKGSISSPTSIETKTVIEEEVVEPAPPKEMSAKRKQWLAQLLEKKRIAKDRAEILANDPHAFDHEKVTKKKKSRGGRRKKRGSDDMSASDYESDGPDSAVKYRRTSKSSKVDSSSEMSDTDSPRITRRRKGKKNSAAVFDSDTSDELDEIFDDMNFGGSSSGSSEMGGDYASLDPMNFLDDSHNVRRNQGRHHNNNNTYNNTNTNNNNNNNRSNSRGRPNTAPVTSIFGSTNLDLSLSRAGGGGTLDDSLKFWESTAMSAQNDLNSFVSDFSVPKRSPTNRTGGPAVVDTLFDLGKDGDDDEELERSWMMATDNASRIEGEEDPLAFSIGSVGGGNSLGGGNSTFKIEKLRSQCFDQPSP